MTNVQKRGQTAVVFLIVYAYIFLDQFIFNWYW